jgi:tRNA(Ile)-lysidine synthase
MKKRYPAIVETLSRSARHLAEASALLDDLAVMDAAQCIHASQLDLTSFAMLSEARQRNLLRWWLQQHDIQAISEARMLQLCSQLCHAGMKKSIHVNVGSDMEIRTYLGGAYLLASRPVCFSAPQERHWQGEPVVLLDDGSRLEFKKVIGQGIAMHLLHQPLYVRFRQGGEKIRLDANRPSRGLKAVFQQYHIPPWQREHVPLLYLGSDLVAVPGAGYAAQCRPQADETGLAVSWTPA